MRLDPFLQGWHGLCDRRLRQRKIMALTTWCIRKVKSEMNITRAQLASNVPRSRNWKAPHFTRFIPGSNASIETRNISGCATPQTFIAFEHAWLLIGNHFLEGLMRGCFGASWTLIAKTITNCVAYLGRKSNMVCKASQIDGCSRLNKRETDKQLPLQGRAIA